MLPPSIVVDLAERVRACKTHLDNAETVADKARAEYNGYLELLTYAESQTSVLTAAEPEQPPAGLLVDELATRGPGWCACGLPGIPGMVHGSISCTEGKPHATPALPEIPVPASRGRFPFEPFTPANTGSDVPA